MKKKQKYYLVLRGKQPGIYTSWDEASQQVTGYTGAVYKAFEEEAEAKHYQALGKLPPPGQATKGRLTLAPDRPRHGLAVDAACSGNPGPTEYRGVDLATGRELFRMGPLAMGNNNLGEFLALVHAAGLLQNAGKTGVPIYSDSVTALAWVRNKNVRTELPVTVHNQELWKLVNRAIAWLQTNALNNPMKKWETDRWGEIPADYGRK